MGGIVFMFVVAGIAVIWVWEPALLFYLAIIFVVAGAIGVLGGASNDW